MGKEFNGETSSLHLTRPFTEDELGELSRGFALATWVDLGSGKVLDSTIYPAKADSTANIWHHACGVWVGNEDREVIVHGKEPENGE